MLYPDFYCLFLDRHGMLNWMLLSYYYIKEVNARKGKEFSHALWRRRCWRPASTMVSAEGDPTYTDIDYTQTVTLGEPTIYPTGTTRISSYKPPIGGATPRDIP